jgi:hypothetical protein
MKLVTVCVSCLVVLACAVLPQRASAFELSVDCDYLGPVINGTANSGLVCELTWDPSADYGATHADYNGFVQYVPGIGNPNATDNFNHLRFGLVGTPQPVIVYLLCTSFTGLHRIFMAATGYEEEHVDIGNRVIYITDHFRNGDAEGSIVAFPCGSAPVGSS